MCAMASPPRTRLRCNGVFLLRHVAGRVRWRSLALAAYSSEGRCSREIIKSRVTDGGNLFVTQPYSPRLFRQRVLPGPHLLHETLMHRMTPEGAQTHWEKAEAEAADEDGAEDTGLVHPLSRVATCSRKCSEDGRQSSGTCHRSNSSTVSSGHGPHQAGLRQHRS